MKKASNRIQLLWKKLSLLGIQSDTPEDLRHHIILNNQLAVTWCLLILAYISIFLHFESNGTLFLFSLIATHIIGLWQVSKKNYNIGRFLSASAPIIFIFLIAVRVYNPLNIEYRIINYKILNVAFFVLPFLVFSLKEKIHIIIGAVISFLCYVMFEPANEIMSRYDVNNIYQIYVFEFFNYSVAIFLLAISVIYLKRNNDKSRRKIKRLLAVSRDRNLKLEKLYIKANESGRLKEQFLANTTHELRTPLNSIYGYTNLLLESTLGSKQDRFLQNIRTSTESLMLLINDILDISKIEANKMEIEHYPFKVQKEMRRVVDLFELKVKEKNINLELDIDPMIEKILVGDPVRLSQIIINLVGNAIKYTPADGNILVHVKSAKSIVNKQWVDIAVVDSGIGIPEEKLNAIFESFTQADPSINRKYGGTGLGLSIVKKLVELQSGIVHVESKEGVGSVFTVNIPYEIGTEEMLQKSVKRCDDWVGVVDKKIRILLAEDNELNAIMAMETIKRRSENIQVDWVKNGLEAVEMVKDNTYNVILMDLQMPVMNGYEAIRIIKHDLRLDIPIIAMSAISPTTSIEIAELNDDVTSFITKPFRANDLLNIIMLCCNSGDVPNKLIGAGQLTPDQLN